MSTQTPAVNSAATGQSAPAENANPKVAQAITTAQNLLDAARDPVSAASVIAQLSDDERAGVLSFIDKITAQSATTAGIKKAIRDAQKARNAGKPKRVRKPAPAKK